MLKKNVASLLIWAVMLLASAPPQAFAQTPAQPAPTGSGHSSSEAQAKPKPDLKAAFAEVTVQTKAGTLLETEIKRLEREGLNAQPQAGYTRKEKILVFTIVAGLVVLAVVLALTTKKGGHTFCDIDPTDPDCIGPR